MKSEQMATWEQAEEYRRGFEKERESHERTKANLQSLSQQWKDVYHELQAKKKEVLILKEILVIKSKVSSNVS